MANSQTDSSEFYIGDDVPIGKRQAAQQDAEACFLYLVGARGPGLVACK
jgi:hypothetical protein